MRKGRKKPKAKPVMGRPTLYDPDYHPESYIALCREGKTRAEICAEWGIDRDTLLEWSSGKKHPDFSGAIKKGDELRSRWWTRFGVAIASGQIKNAQQTMAIFLMKNICPQDYRDRIDHSHSLSVEEMEW